MSDDHERPFVEDGSQHGFSESSFAQLEAEEQRDLMIQWFFQNFEDPASETPWDGENKEYFYIWGGPFSADEEIPAKFSDVATESLIEEVVKEIESSGSDWAPRAGSPFCDDGQPDQNEKPSEPLSLNVYLDDPSEKYGSAEERAARAEALDAIENLRRALQTRRPIGIGHNQPPEHFPPDELALLPQALLELEVEFQKPNPDIARVKHWTTPLRDALIASAKWTLKKIDGALTAAVKFSAVAGVGWIYSHPESLRAAFDTILKWLDLAAQSLF